MEEEAVAATEPRRRQYRPGPRVYTYLRTDVYERVRVLAARRRWTLQDTIATLLEAGLRKMGE